MKINEDRMHLINQRLRFNGFAINQSLQEIKELAKSKEDIISNKIPHISIQKDLRLTSLKKLRFICDQTQFGFHILGKMMDDEWCEDNILSGVEVDDVQNYLLELVVGFENSLKHQFGLTLFTTLEYSFRNFLRAIDSAACKGATTSFESIYKCLLGSNKLNFPPQEREKAEELLNFVRVIRNLIHNDGMYYDEKGYDMTLDYLGNQYSFYNGKMVNFVTWDLLLSIANNILALLVQLVNHPQILILKEVVDPFEEQHICGSA